MTKKASVTEAARAAVHAAEEEVKQRRLEQNRYASAAAKRQHEELVRKHSHLLRSSALNAYFPEAKWTILAVVAEAGKPPQLRVQEAGDTSSPVFNVTADKVWIDYTHRDYTYGREHSAPAQWQVTSALDVGRYLKYQSDAVDESYRRNAD